MQIDLFNGIAYEEGTFNLQGGTDMQSGEKKLQEDIKILLTQEKGKFYPDPEFGSNLQKYLFEPMTPSLGKEMQTEIKDLITKYYPQITLIGIDVDMDPVNKGIYIDIKYKYTDSAIDISSINLAMFNKVDS